MPQTITLPIFGSAGNQSKSAQDQGTQNNNGWQMGESSGDADFDLLAEYLLEDNPTTSAALSFDFNASNIKDSRSILAPPKGSTRDSGAQVQSTTVAQVTEIVPQTSESLQHRAIKSAPAPLAPAPTMISSSPPIVASQGIAVSLPTSQYLQGRTHIAPAPTQASLHHTARADDQSNDSDAKRRRTDAGSINLIGPSDHSFDAMALSAATFHGKGRKKTQAQIDRRRERNRILARRTRLRKKFFFESLQKEVLDLQRENAALKDIVRTQLAEDGQKLLEDCDAMERLPQAVVEACGENANDYDQQDFNLVQSIQQSQHSFVITDPSLQDNPIVFASDDFLKLTGYAREEVLGRNCRFLQGTDTSQEKVDRMRKDLANGEDVSVTLLNYTANGTPFWNKLFIAALRDAQNNIVNYIGVTVRIAAPEEGDPEHGKSLPDEQQVDDDAEHDDDNMLEGGNFSEPDNES